MIEIDRLRELNILERVAITRHAKNRMFERDISVDDIISCIRDGEIIEQYEDDKPLPGCLISGPSVSNKIMHIVVSCDGEFIYLVTAYYPDPDKWDTGFKIRKEI